MYCTIILRSVGLFIRTKTTITKAPYYYVQDETDKLTDIWTETVRQTNRERETERDRTEDWTDRQTNRQAEA